MKIRSIKARISRVLSPARRVVTYVTMIPVIRKKDGEIVDMVSSMELANELIEKAKRAKKAALIAGAPVKQPAVA